MAHLELLDRARRLLASAERIAGSDDVAGAAGLAFQAIDLASKALTIEVDGSDAGSHSARMRRTQELIQVKQEQLDFLWEIRQRDFYGDITLGARRELPSDEQVRRALMIAAQIVEEIDLALHQQEAEEPG